MVLNSGTIAIMTEAEIELQSSIEDASKQAVDILPAGWRDLRQVQGLEKICFGKDAWPWFDLLAALTFPEAVRYKAVLDEQVVGFIVGDRRSRRRTGWIATIGVHPHYRRRGIAKLLMAETEAAMRLPRIRLTLRVSNSAALALYEQLGYSVIDRWKKYYRDGEDGLVMEKMM
jgi:ribosomal protein S18 acetylase RimI-like enzyme